MGALGGASSRLAMDSLFVTCSTISGIPDNLERSIFSWRKVRPVVSIARLVSSSSSLAMASRALGAVLALNVDEAGVELVEVRFDLIVAVAHFDGEDAHHLLRLVDYGGGGGGHGINLVSRYQV